jgi:hypothetical protein
MSNNLRTLLQTCLIAAATVTATHALADGIPGEPPAPGPVEVRRAPDCVGDLPQAYTIVLEGFTGREMMLIEEYLAAFHCYDHMRPLQVTYRHAEYWYEAQTEPMRLYQSSRSMLRAMHLTGNVQFTGSVMRIIKFGAHAEDPETK